MSPLTSLLICVCLILFCDICVHGASSHESRRELITEPKSILSKYNYIYVRQGKSSATCSKVCRNAGFSSCKKNPAFELGGKSKGAYLEFEKDQFYKLSMPDVTSLRKNVCYCQKYEAQVFKMDSAFESVVKSLADFANAHSALLLKLKRNFFLFPGKNGNAQMIIQHADRLASSMVQILNMDRAIKTNDIDHWDIYSYLVSLKENTQHLSKALSPSDENVKSMILQYEAVSNSMLSNIDKLLLLLSPVKHFPFQHFKHLQHSCSKGLQLDPKHKIIPAKVFIDQEPYVSLKNLSPGSTACPKLCKKIGFALKTSESCHEDVKRFPNLMYSFIKVDINDKGDILTVRRLQTYDMDDRTKNSCDCQNPLCKGSK